MTRSLGERGIRVPRGFATTAQAYRLFLERNELEPLVAEQVERIQEDASTLAEAGEAIRKRFLAGELPEEVAGAVRHAYRDLAGRLGREDPDVAARSSATAEDLPVAGWEDPPLIVEVVRTAPPCRDAAREAH